MCASASSLTPGPWSSTLMLSCWPSASRAACRWIVEAASGCASRLASMALRSRLSSTCSSSTRSTYTGGRLSGRSSTIATRLLPASQAHRRTASRASAAASSACRRRGSLRRKARRRRITSAAWLACAVMRSRPWATRLAACGSSATCCR
ncbi:hypothetical protein D9M73_223830 [compost metagenome]